MADYVSAMIGRPWEATGLHCWELVRLAAGDLFGVDLPVVLEAPSGRRTKAELFGTHPARAGWVEAQPPLPWAVALMHRRGGSPTMIEHAGLYLPLDGGGVLHVDAPHGVVFDRLFLLRRARPWSVAAFMVPVETETSRTSAAGSRVAVDAQFRTRIL